MKILLLVIALIACGPASTPIPPENTPTPPPAPVNTPRPTVTAIPLNIEATITAMLNERLAATMPETSSSVEVAINEQDRNNEEEQEEDIQDVEPSPSPTPPPATATPIPTQTPRYRPVGQPAHVARHPDFTFTSGPEYRGNTISFSANLDGRDREITSMQVWQALNEQQLSDKCSTERPLAFVAEPSGSSETFIPYTTPYQWEFCDGNSPRPLQYVDDIPWIAAQQWSYSEPKRIRVSDGWIKHYTVAIDLDDERIWDLEYDSPEGYILIIFMGETLLARQWIQIP